MSISQSWDCYWVWDFYQSWDVLDSNRSMFKQSSTCINNVRRCRLGESFVIAHGFVVPGAGGAEVGGGDYRRCGRCWDVRWWSRWGLPQDGADTGRDRRCRAMLAGGGGSMAAATGGRDRRPYGRRWGFFSGIFLIFVRP